MIRFVDICNAFNIHAFIVWEFVRRYGHLKGVSKDKWGRGYVRTSECNKWVNKLSEYLAFQEYSYKQEINKGQYTYRDRARFEREKESESDIVRRYGAVNGSLTRTNIYRNGTSRRQRWNAEECVWVSD